MAESSRGADLIYGTEESPWANGHIETFNGTMRDELLNREIFYTLIEVKVLIEQ